MNLRSIPSPRLDAAVSAGAPLLFLSAHLDDAVLSCGALLAALAPRCPVTVATVFTAATDPPHTRAARSFLRQCGATDADALFADRRTEDRDVLAGLGVAHVHLGAVDALFRTRGSRAALGRLGRAVPELVHRYPTYRLDIARGRVAAGDRVLAAGLARQVSDLVATTGAELVFCPVGVGNHVDHLLTRGIGARLGRPVVHYSDFPYALSATPDRDFLERHRLWPWTWEHGIAEKRRLIRDYRTQADALFPGGTIPRRPEIYYEPRAIRSA
ncbi:PIG-L deacetylase family protein [Pseudonocardia asaccharolytica]|uniref:PIG-L deacetylase family protein n=1 Tax=Pseudonocardia asaccharolytica TaxID=54010 RepID=UPI00040908F4|nr:PIG-L family deacetylase [Pseudonocardia asaccharolytica]